VGEVTQVDSTGFRGGGFVIKDGCTVLTAAHVAFGNGEADNRVVLVDESEIRVGHVLNFDFDLDEATGRFRRHAKAVVVQFGTFDDQSSEGLVGDIAVLRIVDCPARSDLHGPALGPQTPATFLPTSKLSTIAIRRGPDGIREFSERRCAAYARTPVSGLIFMTCDVREGDSGSMVLHEPTPGRVELAAVMIFRSKAPDGSVVAIGVHGAVVQGLIDTAERALGNPGVKSP